MFRWQRNTESSAENPSSDLSDAAILVSTNDPMDTL
jgi:hypothetical protein